ncbi:MAG: hypothetical protein PHS02_00970, partial [Candidatus ainarchaeum sp.]|nr:hypothetical protein [Candidatus ainarchaeum sp.]
MARQRIIDGNQINSFGLMLHGLHDPRIVRGFVDSMHAKAVDPDNRFDRRPRFTREALAGLALIERHYGFEPHSIQLPRKAMIVEDKAIPRGERPKDFLRNLW